MGVLVLIPNLKGGLTVAARIWEFAALSQEFVEPHPLGVFDNLRKGNPSQQGSWTEGNIELQSSLEETFCNCQMTHIIQNSFHDI